MQERIRGRIEQAIPGATVQVAGEDGEHFEVVVVSAAFEGQSRIDQHRMVMRALKEELGGAVHALQLNTYTPERWKAVRDHERPNAERRHDG